MCHVDELLVHRHAALPVQLGDDFRPGDVVDVDEGETWLRFHGHLVAGVDWAAE